ncbi:hypothetical protein CI109_100026 [Kwoniella shandongensis]|uniref:Uncharacterized protein n=1 Tax=Kwoniella shandongensis TaxID=1734106 RepID=A0A5M6BS97_9TREE|nr:uncharacterized protein CI109_006001 [Kwoniella shandongensis]KAA5525693.1 hypothetical protein CI109_006001 [Kwoniella shandongensis]
MLVIRALVLLSTLASAAVVVAQDTLASSGGLSPSLTSTSPPSTTTDVSSITTSATAPTSAISSDTIVHIYSKISNRCLGIVGSYNNALFNGLPASLQDCSNMTQALNLTIETLGGVGSIFIQDPTHQVVYALGAQSNSSLEAGFLPLNGSRFLLVDASDPSSPLQLWQYTSDNRLVLPKLNLCLSQSDDYGPQAVSCDTVSDPIDLIWYITPVDGSSTNNSLSSVLLPPGNTSTPLTESSTKSCKRAGAKRTAS